MIDWDLLWLLLTLAGLIYTLILLREAWLDFQAATAAQLPLASQQLRREAFRSVEHFVLAAAIAVVLIRERIGDDFMTGIRNSMMAVVSLLLVVNSYLDVQYRRGRDRWRREQDALAQRVRTPSK